MKKLLFLFVPFFILSCASTQPQIRKYALTSDTDMYFLPASTWTGNAISLIIDFNFKTNANIETICNININQEGKLPSGLSSILFNADSVDYPLHAIKVLSVDSRSNTVRITSNLSHDDFLAIMKSKNIFLQTVINETKYECTPTDEFLTLQSEFQNSYLTIGNILK
jgi:hypothetical protein